jgi:nicotinamide mononucleotide (NMN) deamidase PncC
MDEIQRKLAPVEAEVRKRLGNFTLGEDDQTLEGVVLAALAAREGSLAVVETFTAGQIAARIAHLPGAEKVFRRGLVARDPAEIAATLGLDGGLISGELSREEAEAVARAVRQETGASHALAVLIEVDDGPDRIDFGGSIYLAIAADRSSIDLTRIRVGSSPHARGTRFFRCTNRERERFIPACAGNTHITGTLGTLGTVHPRMRGEHCASIMGSSAWNGSSPHARGTHATAVGRTAYPRFIPACAGNTGGPTGSRFLGAVHPRMRGEHAGQDQAVIEGDGSSPHARGTPLDQRGRIVHERFIPACAGNTVKSRISPAHENTRSRFIPACAGNT